MTSLILAEHDNHSLNDVTRVAVTAAGQLGEAVHVLVAGQACRAVADQAAKIEGVDKVLLTEAAHYAEPLAENLAALLQTVVTDAYSHVLAAATTTGKNVMPRLAGLLDVAQVSDIMAVKSPDTFVRPIYAGNALATVQAGDPVKVLTVRGTAFDKAPAEGGSATIEELAPAADAGLSRFVSRELTESDRPELTAARVVVSGGRGLGSAENFRILEALADRLGAAVGASRAAVDAGYVPNDYQVGQTGKVVAPELYIAVGISGAIQHWAGMSGSKVIVAINKDEDAPIFQVADYGLVADLFEVVPQLTEKL
ncbi:FAD-binding protein [Methylonatrum kenyense]|uniref:electron transfer flavoprotein subunit alpha/FixB family protein n=1 Tax=Methylonatrum kenyense TaxID=455253 RepID=UPI0020BD83F0|nr:FAD-binding protein [Methylonatrum kenyense]MCK8517260.1 FAD-binding protein [Methylonatrum kenyense]